MKGFKYLTFTLLALFGLFMARGAFATDYAVTQFDDPAPVPFPCTATACSLRSAIAHVNAIQGTHTITLKEGTYTLSIPGANENGGGTGDLDITHNVTIKGAGADKTIIDASKLGDRVFHILSAGVIVSLENLTITGGDSVTENGGGILNQGKLTISNCYIVKNIISKSNTGGGIRNEGDLTIVNTTISENSAGPNGSGGGIANTGSVTMTNTTVSGNKGTATGGGIANVGTVNITNSTIFGNSPSGIQNKGGKVTLGNTILENNGLNCDGTFITEGHNLSSNLLCNGFDITKGDANGAAGLDPILKDNGGPIPTHALLAGSMAIDYADAASCPATDQRGEARVGKCDVGAVEFTKCGDGVKQTTEECDGEASCDTQCKLIAPSATCGNTVKEAQEECDGGANCDSQCKIVTSQGTPPADSGDSPGCSMTLGTHAAGHFQGISILLSTVALMIARRKRK